MAASNNRRPPIGSGVTDGVNVQGYALMSCSLCDATLSSRGEIPASSMSSPSLVLSVQAIHYNSESLDRLLESIPCRRVVRTIECADVALLRSVIQNKVQIDSHQIIG